MKVTLIKTSAANKNENEKKKKKKKKQGSYVQVQAELQEERAPRKTGLGALRVLVVLVKKKLQGESKRVKKKPKKNHKKKNA